MPKWLILVLVLGLVVVVGCCGGIALCTYGWRQARRMNEQRRERVQVQAGGNAITAGRGLPANFPVDVPVIEGFTASRVSVSDAVRGTGIVMMGGTGTWANVVAEYQRQMKDRGWSQLSSEAVGVTSTMVFAKDTRQVTIRVGESGGSAMLTIEYGPKP
jgi:hypothetical protein